MAVRYSTLIHDYCVANGIEIPVGFGRHSASRYAVVVESTPPKLVARTWFTQQDVVYYLARCTDSSPKRILDFKEGIELIYANGKRLTHGSPFDAKRAPTAED
jgi:hypothetical protein